MTIDLSERFRCEPQHAVLRRGDCAQQHREATAAAHGSAVAVRKAVCRDCAVGIVHAHRLGTPPPAVPMPTIAGATSTTPTAPSARPHNFHQSNEQAAKVRQERRMKKPDRSRDCRDCGKAFQWSAPAQRYCGACKDKRVAAQKGKRKAAHFPAARRRTDRVQSASAPRTESRATAAASTSSMLEDVTALVRVLAPHDATDRERLLASASAILESVA